MFALDHNILIDIQKKTERSDVIRRLIASNRNRFAVLNIGGSELRLRGIRPERYDLFDEFLTQAGIADLLRLDPIGLTDITFIQRCSFCTVSESDMYAAIKEVLFPNGYEIGKGLIEQEPYQPIERKKLNQACDAMALLTSIKHKTEGLVTWDKNFIKKRLELKRQFGATVVRPDEIAL